MKKKRQETILQIIEQNVIGTQEELMLLLQEKGFPVTQATISRDIKELKLVKVLGKTGVIQYMSNQSNASSVNKDKFYTFFAHSVKEIDYAGNICVIKCYEGTANAAGVAVDSMHFATILGSIAGDDTLFIVCRSESGAKDLMNDIQELIREA